MAFTTSAFGRGILGVLVAPSAALSSTNTVAFAVVGDFCEMMLPPAATVVFESPFQPPSPCLESHHLPRPCANNLFPPLGAASVPRGCRQSLQSPVFSPPPIPNIILTSFHEILPPSSTPLALHLSHHLHPVPGKVCSPSGWSCVQIWGWFLMPPSSPTSPVSLLRHHEPAFSHSLITFTLQ
jgi:hypothetical protein